MTNDLSNTKGLKWRSVEHVLLALIEGETTEDKIITLVVHNRKKKPFYAEMLESGLDKYRDWKIKEDLKKYDI